MFYRRSGIKPVDAAAESRGSKRHMQIKASHHFRTTTIVAIFVKAGRIDAV
jgi:hypothetical protein